eukprot:TRINITY_DN3996_c0_g1_i1.p1 TRINITY_DN3996_c0_g1~~TRINITY_DN3996_c0_g1_i1.p1  ORF type:complete len:191 (+),score=53.70 TRINITY_DN3996_c0_g1_i1:30-602(+)
MNPPKDNKVFNLALELLNSDDPSSDQQLHQMLFGHLPQEKERIRNGTPTVQNGVPIAQNNATTTAKRPAPTTLINEPVVNVKKPKQEIIVETETMEVEESSGSVVETPKQTMSIDTLVSMKNEKTEAPPSPNGKPMIKAVAAPQPVKKTEEVKKSVAPPAVAVDVTRRKNDLDQFERRLKEMNKKRQKRV